MGCRKRKKAHSQNRTYLIRILNPRFNKGRKRIDNERKAKKKTKQ